jgi:site-specific recombinase XerD
MNATIQVELKLPAKADGTRTIYIRITQNRKHWRVPVGYSIEAKHWNSAAEFDKKVKSSHPLHKVINAAIQQKYLEAKSELLKSKVNQNALTPALLQRELTGQNSQSFFAFSDIIAARIRQKNFNTFEQYQTALNKLKKYLKNKDLSFDDLTVPFLKSYQAYLQGLGNNQTTVYNSFKVIRAVYYHAIQDELVSQDKNPFFRFRFSAGKANRTKLTQEEIGRIEALELERNTPIWHARNYFLFSFYCAGMRVRDVLQLKWVNVRNGRIDYAMSKTGVAKSIKLIDRAETILSYYRPEKITMTHWIFPALSNTREYNDQLLRMHIRSVVPRINKWLKVVAERAGINKPISMHVSRHSMADIARTKGVDLYNISKLLGHSSLKITEAYLKNDDEKSRDSAMDNIYNS